MASRSRLSRTTVSMRAIAASTRLVSALRLRRAYSSRNQRPRARCLTAAKMASKSPSTGGWGGIVDNAKGSTAKNSFDMLDEDFAPEDWKRTRFDTNETNATEPDATTKLGRRTPAKMTNLTISTIGREAQSA
jgi:hypothetical protein